MRPKKKLFESHDFDKNKKLFTASDFDKESEEKFSIGNSQEGREKQQERELVENQKSNLKNWIWIILGAVAVCIIGYFIFFGSGDTVVTEPAQELEIIEDANVSRDSIPDQESVMGEVCSVNQNDTSAKDEVLEVEDSYVPATTNNIPNYVTPADVSIDSNVKVSNDIEKEAMKVIRGDYGVGQERKDNLGGMYQTIQSRVNELKREGVF